MIRTGGILLIDITLINEKKRLSEISLINTSEPEIERYKWQADYASYYAACDQDKPIYPVWDSFNHIRQWHEDYQIWTDRCESTREKTINWLMNRCPLRPAYWDKESWNYILKMRPIGDERPTDQLFEQWITDHYTSLYPHLDKDAIEGTTYYRKEKIEMAFSSNPAVISMFRRRGIFHF